MINAKSATTPQGGGLQEGPWQGPTQWLCWPALKSD